MGGVFGALAIGFLGTSDVQGADGIFYGGGAKLLLTQLEAVGATVGYSFVATLIIAGGINLVWKMTLTDDQQLEGMDTVLHNESAYETGGLIGSGSLAGASRPINIPREEVDA